MPGTDWAAQATDTIDRVVGSIRDNTTGRVEVVVRAIVYGLLAAIVGTAALVLLAVLIVRVLDILIPGEVWSAHALTGGIFTLVGLFLWRKRTAEPAR